MPPKRNISFTKPPEAPFIKRMKESIGYIEPATVETKKQSMSYEEDDVERDDEKPVIVALSPEDLTEEDLKAFSDKNDGNKKIVFAKPNKKINEEKSSLEFSSRKKDILKKIDSHKEKSNKVKNSSLLSFDEDEDF